MLKPLLTAALLACSLLPAAQAQPMSKGEYLARAGDCIACHTAPDGQPFAGGHALASPLGTIYSTNITPHPEQGIGNYSFADFDKAVRQGKTPQHALYPAMPFASYEKISEADMRALYDYFMQEVEPVAQANRDSDIPWPLNMRWPLSVWSALFTDGKQFVANPAQSDDWNRGAYLVQGLGHCGTCHTPRSATLAEKGYTEASSDFLAGAELGGWYAPSLRGLHQLDDDELVQLLARGHSKEHAFAGPMADVVSYSLSHLEESDIRAMVSYLRSLEETKPTASPSALALNAEQRAEGDLLYLRYCSTCHGKEGEGVDYVAPRLATKGEPHAKQAINLVNVILQGAEGANLQGEIAYAMPSYADVLSDSEVANLANAILSHPDWGRQPARVTPEQVKQLREGPAGLDVELLLLPAVALLVVIVLLVLWHVRRRRRQA